ncbi:exopolysaccharide biosynthesis protein [Aquicoccus sp. SCR17]|nr:exopolysaccharide biosynthesis protein [Carideicomes alvinocaridis]
MADGTATMRGCAPPRPATAPPRTLGELIDAIRHCTCQEDASVADMMGEIGDRSFAPAVLLPALLLVSPLSGIPGTPTIGAIIVLTIALQWLRGRRHLWLPRFVMDRSIPARRLTQALDFLERPARWIDKCTRHRLDFMVQPPMRTVTIVLICLLALTWPPLEFVPMVTSVSAFAVALLALGQMARDGVVVLAGYLFVGASTWGVMMMATAAQAAM